MFVWVLSVIYLINIVRASHDISHVSKHEPKENSFNFTVERNANNIEIKISNNQKKNEKNGGNNIIHRGITIFEFVQAFIQILLKYEDSELRKVIAILIDEMANYQYEGSKFHELTENHELMSYIANKLNKFKGVPANDIRKQLTDIQTKIKINKYAKTERDLIDLVRKLYMKGTVEMFQIVLKNFEEYRLKKGKINDPILLVRHAVRSILFDYYTNLNPYDQEALKFKVNSYWNYFVTHKDDKSTTSDKPTTTTTIQNKKQTIKQQTNNDRVYTTSKLFSLLEEGYNPANFLYDITNLRALIRPIPSKVPHKRSDKPISSPELLIKPTTDRNFEIELNLNDIDVTESNRERSRPSQMNIGDRGSFRSGFTTKHNVFIDLMTMKPFVPKKKPGLDYKCVSCKKSTSTLSVELIRKTSTVLSTNVTRRPSVLDVNKKAKTKNVFSTDIMMKPSTSQYRRRSNNHELTNNVPDLIHVTYNPVDPASFDESEATILSHEEISGIPIPPSQSFLVDKDFLAHLRYLDNEMKIVKTQVKNKTEVVNDLKKRVRGHEVKRALLRRTLKTMYPIFRATTRKLINTRFKYSGLDDLSKEDKNIDTTEKTIKEAESKADNSKDDLKINNKTEHEINKNVKSNIYKTEENLGNVLNDKSSGELSSSESDVTSQYFWDPKTDKIFKHKNNKIIRYTPKQDLIRQARFRSKMKTNSNHANIDEKKTNYKVIRKSSNSIVDKSIQLNNTIRKQYHESYIERRDTERAATVTIPTTNTIRATTNTIKVTTNTIKVSTNTSQARNQTQINTIKLTSKTALVKSKELTPQTVSQAKITTKSPLYVLVDIKSKLEQIKEDVAQGLHELSFDDAQNIKRKSVKNTDNDIQLSSVKKTVETTILENTIPTKVTSKPTTLAFSNVSHINNTKPPQLKQSTDKYKAYNYTKESQNNTISVKTSLNTAKESQNNTISVKTSVNAVKPSLRLPTVIISKDNTTAFKDTIKSTATNVNISKTFSSSVNIPIFKRKTTARVNASSTVVEIARTTTSANTLSYIW